MARRVTRKRRVIQPPLGEEFVYDGSTPLPNVREELFCELYTSNTTPSFFGHGQNCYIFAYGYQEKLDKLETEVIGADSRRGRGVKRKKLTELDTKEREIKRIKGLCRTQGSFLLTKPHILARTNHLMDQLINDKIVDRELAFVIQQRYDLSSKTSAIQHFDKKRGRLIEKSESLIKFEPVTAIEFVVPVKAK